jgi:hypothetical protein
MPIIKNPLFAKPQRNKKEILVFFIQLGFLEEKLSDLEDVEWAALCHAMACYYNGSSPLYANMAFLIEKMSLLSEELKDNKRLLKLVFEGGIGGELERRTGVYKKVYEDSPIFDISTSMNKLLSTIECQKKPNIYEKKKSNQEQRPIQIHGPNSLDLTAFLPVFGRMEDTLFNKLKGSLPFVEKITIKLSTNALTNSEIKKGYERLHAIAPNTIELETISNGKISKEIFPDHKIKLAGIAYCLYRLCSDENRRNPKTKKAIPRLIEPHLAIKIASYLVGDSFIVKEFIENTPAIPPRTLAIPRCKSVMFTESSKTDAKKEGSVTIKKASRTATNQSSNCVIS